MAHDPIALAAAIATAEKKHKHMEGPDRQPKVQAAAKAFLEAEHAAHVARVRNASADTVGNIATSDEFLRTVDASAAPAGQTKTLLYTDPNGHLRLQTTVETTVQGLGKNGIGATATIEEMCSESEANTLIAVHARMHTFALHMNGFLHDSDLTAPLAEAQDENDKAEAGEIDNKE